VNIFQQEDIVKGMPDQALMQEAQQPSGNPPQYLVISEIQRRADMRKRFAGEQQSMPETTVKDQIVSGGIAGVGQQRQAPQGGMMPPQPQMPAAQPMPPQQPMPVPPQGMPQQMPQQQLMARGGVIRMSNGQDTPYWTPQGATLEELAGSIYDYERQPGERGTKRYGETRSEVVSRILGPDVYQIPMLPGLGARPKFIESAMQSGALQKYLPEKESFLEKKVDQSVEGGMNTQWEAPTLKESLARDATHGFAVQSDASRIGLDSATELDRETVEAGSRDTDPSAKVNEDLGKEKLGYGSSIRRLGEVSTEVPDVKTAYEEIIKRHENTTKGITEKVDALDDIDYKSQFEPYKTDFSKYIPDYSDLITEQELRAKKIEEDAKKDVGAHALIELGAGILEGDVGGGLRGAGKAASTIMREARAESAAQRQAADALKVSAQQATMTLGIAGEEAAARQISENNQMIAKQLSSDREKELVKLGMEADSAKNKADLEGKALQIFATVSLEEKELLIEKIVKEATIIRYQDLREEQKSATMREVMEVMRVPAQEWVKEWMSNNQTLGSDGSIIPPSMDKFEKEFKQYINVWMRSFGQEDQNVGGTDDLTKSTMPVSPTTGNQGGSQNASGWSIST